MTAGNELDPNLAFRLYFGDPDWRVKSGIGGVIAGAAFLFLFLHTLSIPLACCCWALLIGYNLRLMRSKMADMNAALPKWNDWLDLLISGLTWIAVSFGQNLVPITVATITLLIGGVRGSRYVLSNDYPIWAASSVAAITFTWVFVSLVSSVIIVNFAKQERMAAAFDVFTVGRKLGTQPLLFIKAWLLVLGLQWVGFIVPVVTVVGVFFIPLCSFIASNIGAIILAQAWRASESTETSDAAA